jgi:hypothetical protein
MKFEKKIVFKKIFFFLLDNKKDFRFIPFTIVFTYIFTLFYSEFYLGSYKIIGKYFRIHPIPYFIDLKVLLCGIDAIRLSVDPYSSICFYGGSSWFNYPIVWGFLSFIPFFTMSNLIYIGIGLALTLFISVYFFIGKINFLGSIVYTSFLISPAIMLGFDRGNSDLIIFILLLIFHLILKKYNILGSFIIIIISMLKLFPIGAIICILNKKSLGIKKSFLIFLTICVSFITYLIVMKDNILLVSKKTPRPYGEISYGLGGIPSLLINHFKEKYYFYFQLELYKKYPDFDFFIFLLFIFLILVLFFIYNRFFRFIFTPPLIEKNNEGNSYLIGAGIFLVTCLIGYNWEYRLVFLIFTIPQLLIWLPKYKFFASILLFLSILIVWQSFINRVINIFIIQFFVLFLFLSHLNIIINFLNDFYTRFYELYNKTNLKLIIKGFRIVSSSNKCNFFK